MTVILTSPVLGKSVGENYTGTMEAWLLANGYARQDGYTGPGVSNTGAVDVAPADDPTLAENREAPYFPLTEDRHVTIANDATHLNQKSLAAPGFDLDAGGVDTEAPSSVVLKPKSGKVAGGTKVTITGDNLEGVTAVNFDVTPGTALDVSTADEGVITVVSPAHAAGAVNVTLVDASGNTVQAAGFTYNA